MQQPAQTPVHAPVQTILAVSYDTSLPSSKHVSGNFSEQKNPLFDWKLTQPDADPLPLHELGIRTFDQRSYLLEKPGHR